MPGTLNASLENNFPRKYLSLTFPFSLEWQSRVRHPQLTLAGNENFPLRLCRNELYSRW